MALSRNLIDMETEFRIMNQELELKTVELMKKAEDVVKFQENAVYDFTLPENGKESDFKNKFYRMDEINKLPEDNTMQYCWYSDDSQNKLRNRRGLAPSLKTKNLLSPTRHYNAPSSEHAKSLLSDCKMSNNEDHVDNLLAIKNRIKGQSMFPDISKPNRYGSMPNLKNISNSAVNANSSSELPINSRLRSNINDYTFNIDDFQGEMTFEYDVGENGEDDDKTDEDEDDNIERIMRALEDQKSFNKTLDNLMKRKDSIRNNATKDANRKKLSLPYSNINTSFLESNKTDKAVPIIRIEEEDDLRIENNNDARSSYDDTIIKALKEKIKSLQEELQKCNETLKKKSHEYSDASKNNQALEENKKKLISQINNLKTQSIKHDGKINMLTSKLQTKETECRALRTERDKLSRVIKDSEQSNSGTEARLNKAREGACTLRDALVTAKQQEKDLRDSTKRQIDELSQELASAEKRAKSATTAVKKQAQLIDNLKRQIQLLTISEEVKKSDAQFDGILKWQHKQ